MIIKDAKKIYCIGIGGIGVSALARMLLQEGKQVRGSDTTETELTRQLALQGIKIDIGQSADLIPADTELVIYTVAVAVSNPKLLEDITTCGFPLMSYPEALGQISKEKYTIAVAGTHGKTTTTAMIARVLIEAKKEAAVIVGSLLNQLDGTKSNFIAGKSKYFLVEACEYRRSFLNLKPTIAIITNIDNDHLDYYQDIDDIVSAFIDFASQAEIIICNPEDENTKKMLSGLGDIGDKKVVNFLKYYDSKINLRVPGEHNRRNASVALAVADILRVSMEEAKRTLKEFSGTWRRFEYKGTLSNGTIIYDDYAHHPTEIQATLAGAREFFPDKKITAIFQPHLFSRTKLLLNQFANSFESADKIYIAPIYAAREQFDQSINSTMLVDQICRQGGKADLFQNFNFKDLGPDDVLIILGAGDIYLHTARLLGL